MANEIYNSSWWGFSSSTGFGNIYDKYNNPDKLANFFEIRVGEYAKSNIAENNEQLEFTNDF